MAEAVAERERELHQLLIDTATREIAAFDEALALNSDDKLSAIYTERCRYFQVHPPADGWDGVWTMKSK